MAAYHLTMMAGPPLRFRARAAVLARSDRWSATEPGPAAGMRVRTTEPAQPLRSTEPSKSGIRSSGEGHVGAVMKPWSQSGCGVTSVESVLPLSSGPLTTPATGPLVAVADQRGPTGVHVRLRPHHARQSGVPAVFACRNSDCAAPPTRVPLAVVGCAASLIEGACAYK
jgi:hypothetical protein